MNEHLYSLDISIRSLYVLTRKPTALLKRNIYMEVDKEKYERRYKWNNHMRGIVMGILLTVIYYEFIA